VPPLPRQLPPFLDTDHSYLKRNNSLTPRVVVLARPCRSDGLPYPQAKPDQSSYPRSYKKAYSGLTPRDLVGFPSIALRIVHESYRKTHRSTGDDYAREEQHEPRHPAPNICMTQSKNAKHTRKKG